MSAQTIHSAGAAGRTAESADRLEIAGWSTDPAIDLWPGHRALTVRLQGCPWTCSNCEQPELRDTLVGGTVSWEQVRAAVVDARDEIDGVVLTGGEPTRQHGLADAIEQIRALGLPVVLHTSGAYPRHLAGVLDLVDRVVFDVRATATLYRAATGVGSSAHQVFTSLRAVLESGVDLEVRSCVDPAVVGPAEVGRLVSDLAAMGVRHHVVTERTGTPRAARAVRRVPVGAGRVPARA